MNSFASFLIHNNVTRNSFPYMHCVLQDDKDEKYMFSFDKVFYDDSEQADVYEFLARPIVIGINCLI